VEVREKGKRQTTKAQYFNRKIGVEVKYHTIVCDKRMCACELSCVICLSFLLPLGCDCLRTRSRNCRCKKQTRWADH
jgi:hypothetical protein